MISSLLIAAAPRLRAQQTPAQQAGWKLQGDMTLMAGQYFFNGASGAVNGFADADVQLLRSLSSVSGFYLDGHTTYNGFKQVNELAGGGTLFQQSWDNSLEGKYVHRFEDGYSLKPRVAARSELFRETVDESWGDGLYDSWRYETGLVLEHKTRLGLEIPWTWQLSHDLYYTRYPHFRSLVGQFGTEQTAPDPGSRVLDTVSNQFAFRNEFDLPNFVSVWALYSISFISFTDQKIVQSEGQFVGTNRSDAYQTFNTGVSKRYNDWETPRLGPVRPVAGLNFTVSDLISNQNDYDAVQLKFIGSYYDYWETRLAPDLTMTMLKTKTVARVGAEFAMRRYTGRLGQNADGSYTDSKLHQYTESFSFEAAQPVWRDLDLKFRAAWENTSANTSFEQSYVYNYHDWNYFAGVGWKF